MSKTYNHRSLAAALGVNHGQVSRWTKRAGWPLGPAPWTDADLEKVREWRKGLQEDRAKPAGESEHALKLRLMQARIDKLEAEHGQFTHQYVLKADVDAANVAKVREVREALMNNSGLIGDLQVCRTPSEMQDAVNRWAKAICDRFAGVRDES